MRQAPAHSSSAAWGLHSPGTGAATVARGCVPPSPHLLLGWQGTLRGSRQGGGRYIHLLLLLPQSRSWCNPAGAGEERIGQKRKSEGWGYALNMEGKGGRKLTFSPSVPDFCSNSIVRNGGWGVTQPLHSLQMSQISPTPSLSVTSNPLVL